MIPVVLGCLVYSICICKTVNVRDNCYNSEFMFIPISAFWEWIQGFQNKQDKIASAERNLENEKVALVLLSSIFLGILVYNLVKWIKTTCRNWKKLNNTILKTNHDGNWEYAPSCKRLEETNC